MRPFLSPWEAGPLHQEASPSQDVALGVGVGGEDRNGSRAASRPCRRLAAGTQEPGPDSHSYGSAPLSLSTVALGHLAEVQAVTQPSSPGPGQTGFADTEVVLFGTEFHELFVNSGG